MTTWGFGKITAVFAIAGVLLAWAVSFAMPVEYASQAVVRMVGNDADITAFMTDLEERTLTRNALTTAIMECGLYSKERAKKPMEDVVKIMEGRIVINLLPAPAAPSSVLVQFVDQDGLVAQKVVQRLVALLIDENVRGHHGSESAPNIVDLVGPASLPQRPVSPARLNVMTVGLAAGVLAGVLLAAVRRRSRVRAA